MKKHIILIATLALAIGSVVGLTSCDEEVPMGIEIPEETVPEDIYFPNDNAIGGPSEIILDVALKGIGLGIREGASLFTSELSEWIAEGIGSSLGIYTSDAEKYYKLVSERLDQVDQEIKDLDTKVDWLIDKVDDSRYLIAYNDFLKQYDTIQQKVKDAWQFYVDIESKINDKDTTVDLEHINNLITKLCDAIRDGESESSLNHLDILANSFGKSFLSKSGNVSQLDKHGIIYIIERFINKQTPFLDNRCKLFKETITDFYNTFYQASFLANFEYITTLQRAGIINYTLTNDSTLVSYSYKDENNNVVTKMNCRKSSKDDYIKKYKESGVSEEELSKFEKLDPVPLLDYKNGVVAQVDHRIENTTGLYNEVNNLVNKFLEQYKAPEDERHLSYDDGTIQKTKIKVKTLIPNDFITTTWETTNLFHINYDNFGNITKNEFIKYVNHIAPMCKVNDDLGRQVNLTFRQFFEREGYQLPDNNNADYLLLGVDKNSFERKEGYYHKPFIIHHCFNVFAVDLDKKVIEFKEDHRFVRFTYAAYRMAEIKNSGCKTKEYYFEYLIESKEPKDVPEMLRNGKINNGVNEYWSSPATKFYTIFGLSTNPKKGYLDSRETTF